MSKLPNSYTPDIKKFMVIFLLKNKKNKKPLRLRKRYKKG